MSGRTLFRKLSGQESIASFLLERQTLCQRCRPAADASAAVCMGMYVQYRPSVGTADELGAFASAKRLEGPRQSRG
jgi:hypothetical protein